MTREESDLGEFNPEQEVTIEQEEEPNDEASENSNEDEAYSGDERDGKNSYKSLALESVQDNFSTICPRNWKKQKAPQRYIPWLNTGGEAIIFIWGSLLDIPRELVSNESEGRDSVCEPGKPGVDNDPGMQYIDGVLNLNLVGQASMELPRMSEEEMEEHMLGVILHISTPLKGIQLRSVVTDHHRSKLPSRGHKIVKNHSY